MKIRPQNVPPPISKNLGRINPAVRLLTNMKTPLLRTITSVCLLLTAGLAASQAQTVYNWDPTRTDGSGGGGGAPGI